MRPGYTSHLRERIAEYPNGTVFSGTDLADIAEADTRRRILNRMVKEGRIRRVMEGIYEKPQFSELLQEYVAPSPDQIAQALARSNRWSIAPCGNTALNMLGLSTQVTSVWSYISDGPYKTIDLGRIKLEFKHRANKDISGLSDISALVIQALKALGRNQINEAVITHLSHRLSEEEKKTLLCEGKKSTSWVYDMIKRICEGMMLNEKNRTAP